MANNIIKRIWNQNRMVNIEDLCGMAFQAESGGHTFEISGVDDTGAAVPLSGTVAGVFRRPDNADIALTGAASGGVVSVTLTNDCYAVPGRFGLTVFITSGGQKTAVYAAVGTVAATNGGAVAGDTPQDVVDLINAIAAAVATIPASYTDLMTAIAPVYSSSAFYPLGAYSWYDGHLYRCTTPITTAETWTAAHWNEVALGDDVSGLSFMGSTERLVWSGNGVNIHCATSPVSFTPVSGSQVWRYAVCDCEEGDAFTVTGTGGISPRLWCFVDSNNNILSNAGQSASLTDGVVFAPAGAKKFIVNDNTQAGYAYKGVRLDKILYGNKNKLGNFPANITRWRPGVAGHSSSNPVTPANMPANTMAYGSGAAFSGFNNTLFTLGSADGYWFFKASNVLADGSDAPVSLFLVAGKIGNNYKVYMGTSVDAGVTVTWYDVSGGGITNYIDYISNTYNVTATPSITADTNNYLAATGTTADRTADIAAMLAQTGVCNLGPGLFYVNNLQMPRETVLKGCGNATKLVYNGSSDGGYAVKLGYYCTIEDLLIEQGTSGYTPTSINIGSVHGIVFEGDADESTPTFVPRFCTITNCHIRYFTGGGITCRNTGPQVLAGVQASNCSIVNCGAGVNVFYNSEYHEFTNIKCYRCGIGLVNNGGNNKFVNCDFSQNIQGVLMDNSSGQSPNNGHGSLVGCTINHSNDNTGVAIEINGITPGFNFTACHVYYGSIKITNSKAIVFGDLNAGTLSINISGGGVIIFHDSAFTSAPAFTVTGNSNVHVDRCYTKDGAVVTL